MGAATAAFYTGASYVVSKGVSRVPLSLTIIGPVPATDRESEQRRSRIGRAAVVEGVARWSWREFIIRAEQVLVGGYGGE